MMGANVFIVCEYASVSIKLAVCALTLTTSFISPKPGSTEFDMNLYGKQRKLAFVFHKLTKRQRFILFSNLARKWPKNGHPGSTRSFIGILGSPKKFAEKSKLFRKNLALYALVFLQKSFLYKTA